MQLNKCAIIPVAMCTCWPADVSVLPSQWLKLGLWGESTASWHNFQVTNKKGFYCSEDKAQKRIQRLITTLSNKKKMKKSARVSVHVKRSCANYLKLEGLVQQTWVSIFVTLLTRQTLPLSGLQQNGPLSVQVSRLAALAQVGLGNVLPVDAHAVYVLPGTRRGRPGQRLIHIHTVSLTWKETMGGERLNATCTCHSRSCSRRHE